jgi:hypothetical protein
MGNPFVGQLQPQHEGYPDPLQPGGPGTQVTDPTQPSVVYQNGTPPNFYTPTTNPTPYNERAAMFFPACGHAIRSWEVRWDAVNGDTMALIVCPLCGYLVDILTPQEALDVNINPLILG